MTKCTAVLSGNGFGVCVYSMMMMAITCAQKTIYDLHKALGGDDVDCGAWGTHYDMHYCAQGKGLCIIIVLQCSEKKIMEIT